MYPGYNSFVESHISRFHTTSEEMIMIYYQFAFENNMIIQKFNLFNFFQIPHYVSDCIPICILQFIIYRIIL